MHITFDTTNFNMYLILTPTGMGLQLTHAIINEERTRSGLNSVSVSTVRDSAKKEFAGKCHNRGTKKTGSKDKTSPWAKARLQFGIQLQQQFREDTPGESMIGKTVVKMFDDEVYMGKIVYAS